MGRSHPRSLSDHHTCHTTAPTSHLLAVCCLHAVKHALHMPVTRACVARWGRAFRPAPIFLLCLVKRTPAWHMVANVHHKCPDGWDLSVVAVGSQLEHRAIRAAPHAAHSVPCGPGPGPGPCPSKTATSMPLELDAVKQKTTAPPACSFVLVVQHMSAWVGWLWAGRLQTLTVHISKRHTSQLPTDIRQLLACDLHTKANGKSVTGAHTPWGGGLEDWRRAKDALDLMLANKHG